MLDKSSNGIEVPTLLETLYERLGEEENLELEFKSGGNALPRSIWETVSAFANTKGGWIILGVEEKNGNFEVAGVTDASALLNNFYSQLRNTQKISFSICGADDARIEELDGKQIVILRTPAASRKNRPVFIGNNPYKGTYLRRNSGDYLCNKQEVDQMMREASADSATSTILPNYNLGDIDLDSLTRYRRRYQTANPAATFNSYEDLAFLRAIDGFKRNRASGAESLTVAGLLMFGKDASLREWRTRHLIDYRNVVHKDGNEDRRWDDRIPWEGNLFGAFELIYPKLIKSQPVPFKLVHGVRVDDPPSHVALREALVNLLVHTDYSEPDASLIVHSPESYLFRNPGSSRVLETDLLTGNRSDPRNPELVRMFRYIGACDEGGTGIPKIISNWKGLGYRIPTIDTGTERYEFSIELRQIHLISEEDRTWLGTLGSSWSEAEQLALVMAKYDGDVDNFRLRQITNQHPADVTKVLRGLKARNLLKMIGTGHKAKYELGDSATENLFFSVSRAGGGLNPTTKAANHTTKPDIYTSKEESNTTKPPYAETKPEDVWSDLEQIANSFKGQRRSKPEIRELAILSLLDLAPLSIQELISLTGLSKAYLHQRIQSLFRKEHISFLFPDQPSHPLQKYILSDRKTT